MAHIECENLLKSAFKDGINLFCGAGFSLLAKNKEQKNLPTGEGLLNELKTHFSSVKIYSKLPMACTKLKETDKATFEKFITQRFEVDSFSPLYFELEKINIRNIFTTNVDDLWFKIFYNSKFGKCLVDRAKKGATYENKSNLIVDYYALHGNIKNGSGYVFGTTEIASAFSNSVVSSSWESLAYEASGFPILFWGWNFEDHGPLEAIYSNKKNISENINKWFVLYEGEKNLEETKDFLKTLGFNLIITNTEDFLKYIENFNNSFDDYIEEEHKETSDFSNEFKEKYCIPNREKIPSSSFSTFFTNYKPEWSFFFSHNVHKTCYYKELADKIASNRDIIVTGIRGAGKTTLFMQLLIDLQTNRMKNFLIEPSLEDAKIYLKKLNGCKSLLFVDGCFRDTEALLILLDAKNVQLVGFDRDFNYESQSHRLEHKDYIPIDITNISIEDAQHILDSIPIGLRKTNASTNGFEKDPTIPTFLAKILNDANFNFLQRFYENDNIAAEIFLLICYIHYCGIPCSYDMIYAYLGDEKYSWKDIYNVIERSGKLISEYSENSFHYEPLLQEDYYQCRSRFFAEKILNSIKSEKVIVLLKDVVSNFLKKVPVYKICSYDKFKKSAYDAELISRVFPDELDGEIFYSKCIEKDNSEYMYQQAALYFSRLKKYKKAFEWIDRAKSIEHYNRFSIESTYAIVYFYANFKINNGKQDCRQALNILENCCRNDKRKATHFLAYSRAVINYIEYYKDDVGGKLRETALYFIQEGLREENRALCKNHKYELRRLGTRLEEM